jgi:ubiquinone biosynthesis protein COQ9
MTDADKLREDLLQASLGHVAFDGWSRTALRAAARDLGVDPALAHNAFPGGEAELIEAFSAWADGRMLDALDKRGLAAMKVRERIAAGVRLRLEALEPHREAVRRGLAFFALPQNGPLGLKCLYRTVDAIWYAAGDRATDYNFYTKRLLLAGVYSSTLLVWLNDGSEGHAATWAFLERRIAEVLEVAGRLGKVVTGALDLPDRMARRFAPRPARR